VPSGLGPEGCVLSTPQSQNGLSQRMFQRHTACRSTTACASACADPTPPSRRRWIRPIPPFRRWSIRCTAPTKSCTDGATNLIYCSERADFAPMLRAVQPLLSAKHPELPRRCTRTPARAPVWRRSFDSTKRIMKDPAPGATPNYAFYFDDNSHQVNCLLDGGGDNHRHRRLQPVLDHLQTPTRRPTSRARGSATTRARFVPFVVSVPSTSSQQSISTEALHIVFGLGGRTGGLKG